MKISVVIPVINEAEGIGEVIQECRKWAHEIIVVDGGSTDGTQQIARKLGAFVVPQMERGYGLALLTGFKAATGDIIATADGDGTYPVKRIPEFAEMVERGEYWFISGNRFNLTHPQAMSHRNQIGNKLLTLVANILFPATKLEPFNDVLSGMWVFKKDCFKLMKLHSRKWDLSQEIKIEARRMLGGKFREIHIDYLERRGVSKLMAWRVGFENLCYFFAHRFGVRFLIHPRYDFEAYGKDDWDGHWIDFGKASDESPATRFRNKLIFAELNLFDCPATKVVEVGFGQGSFAEHLGRHTESVKYVGFEESLKGIEQATERTQPANKTGRFEFKRTSEMVKRSDADFVVCSEVIEHLDDPITTLRNCREALRVGGKIVVTVPGGPLNEFYRHIGHRRHYTAETLVELLKVSGFEMVRFYAVGFPFFNLYRLLIRWGGSAVIDAAKRKPSRLMKFVLGCFYIAFHLDIKRWGWQLVAVAEKR